LKDKLKVSQTKNLKKNEQTSSFTILFFLFLIILPLVYSGEIIDPTLIPRQICLSVFLILLLGLILLERKKLDFDFRFFKLSFPIASFLFLSTILISLFQTRIFSEGLYVLSKHGAIFVFFFLTTFLLIQKQINTEQLTKYILYFTIITLVIAYYQLINLENGVEEVKGTMANKNLLASILFLCLPFNLNFIIITNNGWKKLGWTSIILSIVLLWFLQTRAVLIPILSLGFIGSIIYMIKQKKMEPSKIRIWIVILCLIVVAAFALLIKFHYLFAHLFNTNTFKTRALLWENTTSMIKDHFFTGVGAGNWMIKFPKYGLGNFSEIIKNGRMIYTRPHNDFLWYFSELGIIGFISFVALFILSLSYLNKLNKQEKERNGKLFYLILFLSLIGFMFIAAVDFPMERIEHQILLFLIFSIIVSKYWTNFSIQSNEQKILPKFNYLNFGIFSSLLCVVGFSLLVSKNRYSGEKATVQVYETHQASNWSELINQVDLAKNYFYQVDPVSVPLDWYKGVGLFSLGYFQEAKNCFNQAFILSPNNIHILNNLASSHEKLKEHQKAISYYSKSLKISPDFEESLLNLSAVYFNSGQIEKAFHTINKCNIQSKDPKYMIFLPVILRSKIKLINPKLNVDQIENQELLKLFFESKQKNTTFDYEFKHSYHE
jgi:O-antigen ligase